MHSHSDPLVPIFLGEEVKDKKTIENPWLSRPLDVHRWSEHPEVVSLVETIWQAYFAAMDLQGKAGPKPKRSFQHQLRVLILDLYVAWLENPELSIGVSLSENAWHTGSRYNALHISKAIIPLIHGLEAAGLIDLAKGSYSGPYAQGNRTTRIRAAAPLQAMFRAANVVRDDVVQAQGQECIILKAGDGDKAKTIEYEDTPATFQMRNQLLAYNTLLAGTFIDIPTLDDPWVIRKDGWGQDVKVQIDPHHQFVRRIFSRGDWGCNGRFYGPWWQQIGKKLRSQIFINDTPTVEVDYKGLHVMILSAQSGVAIGGDPYLLDEGVVPNVEASVQRRIIKQLVLTALNARNRKAAFGSFRDGFPTGHFAKGMTNDTLDTVLTAFTTRHPHLKQHLCADQGIRLMNIDSQLAAFVQGWFTVFGVPVLSVHDSFIIDYTRVGELKEAMAIASETIVGKTLAVEANGLGLLEAFAGEPDVKLDFEAWRETARSEGYLSRLLAWEERKGKEVQSYSMRRRNTKTIDPIRPSSFITYT